MTNQIVAQGFIDSNMIITQGYSIGAAVIAKIRLKINAEDNHPFTFTRDNIKPLTSEDIVIKTHGEDV